MKRYPSLTLFFTNNFPLPGGAVLQDHVSSSVTMLPVGDFMQEVGKKEIVILNSMLQAFETVRRGEKAQEQRH